MIEIGTDYEYNYYDDYGISFMRQRKPRKPRKPIVIQWRKLFRLFFRLAIIALIVGSCTQSISWLGEMSMSSSRRYKPDYYRQHNYQYRNYDEEEYEPPRSSTRYNEYQQPIEEDDEEENNNAQYRY
jgi:hypothetical protein